MDFNGILMSIKSIGIDPMVIITILISGIGSQFLKGFIPAINLNLKGKVFNIQKILQMILPFGISGIICIPFSFPDFKVYQYIQNIILSGILSSYGYGMIKKFIPGDVIPPEKSEENNDKIS